MPVPGKGRGTSPESKDFGLSRRLRAGRKDIILLGKSVFHFTSKTLAVSVDGSSVNNFQRGSEIITTQEINKKCPMFQNLLVSPSSACVCERCIWRQLSLYWSCSGAGVERILLFRTDVSRDFIRNCWCTCWHICKCTWS